MSVIKTFMRKAYMQGARLSGLSALLNPVLGGVGSILMLHHVRPARGGVDLNGLLSVEPDFLDELIEGLKGEVRFVSMDEAADRLKAGHCDERFAAVTLDDGYRDNVEHAAPVFRAHEIPYTIFVSPGLVDGDADLWWELVEQAVEKNDRVRVDLPSGAAHWNCATDREKYKAYDAIMQELLTAVGEDEQRAIVRSLCETYGIDREAHRRQSLLDWDELRALGNDRLATIGAHTIHHFQLARLTRERALEEIVRSGEVLGDKLGEKPRHFAYPYGGPEAAGEREVELAREAGYATAVTTRHGNLMPAHAGHMHALPRISVNGYYQRVAYVRTMMSGVTVPPANKGRKLVTV